MTELYAVGGEDCGETPAIFSTLEKAKASIEAEVLKSYRDGQFGRDLTQGPPPEFTWIFERWDGGEGWTYRAWFNPTYILTPGHGVIYTITLDPERLR